MVSKTRLIGKQGRVHAGYGSTQFQRLIETPARVTYRNRYEASLIPDQAVSEAPRRLERLFIPNQLRIEA